MAPFHLPHTHSHETQILGSRSDLNLWDQFPWTSHLENYDVTSEPPPESATTVIEDTPCQDTLQEEKGPFPALEIQRSFQELIETLVKTLAANFPPQESVIEREISRLCNIFPSMDLESDIYVALALYNARQTDDLRAPIPDFSDLRDHIQRKAMGEFEPSELVFYLLTEVVIMDLLAPHKNLPPPAGPCWTYEPLRIIDAQARSTQLTKVLTFVDCFDLVRQARDILPQLQDLERTQAQDIRTPRVIEEWEEMWIQVRRLHLNLQPQYHQQFSM